MRVNEWVCRLALAMGLALASVAPCAAVEVWISPAAPAAGSTIGNWGLTSAGVAKFSFGVPENMSSFTSAHVVVIGNRNGSTTWDQYLSLAANNETQDGLTDQTLGTPLTTTSMLMQELDVTNIFQRNASTMVPGVDSVTLSLNVRRGVQVVGLRFVYAGPVGPTGPQGPVGLGRELRIGLGNQAARE